MSIKTTILALCALSALSACCDKETDAEYMPPAPVQEKELCIRSFVAGYTPSIQKLAPGYALFSFKSEDEKELGYTPICSSEATDMMKAAGYVPATLSELQMQLQNSKVTIPVNTVILGERVADERGINFPVYRDGIELHDVNTTWLKRMHFLARKA